MPTSVATVKKNAMDAALVAVGMPVVVFDRVSSQLNDRFDLHSYLDLSRERAEGVLAGYRSQIDEMTDRVNAMVKPASKIVRGQVARVLPDPVEAVLAKRYAEAREFVEGVTEQVVPKPAPARPKSAAPTASGHRKAASPKAAKSKTAAKKKASIR